MFKIFKSQSTDENETDDVRGATKQEHISRSLDSGPTSDDAASESATDATLQEPAIELDEVFGLLKNRRRRDVLRHLNETTETMRLGELAERIAARECEKDVSQINSQERKRVYVGLYQCHLPKLADHDVITYNKPRGTIERGPNFEQITHYLPAEVQPLGRDAPDRPILESLSSMLSTARTRL